MLELEYECRVDNFPIWEPCTSPHDVSGLLPGMHTFRVRAVDLMGNVDGSPDTRTWTLVAPPITTFDTGPQGRIITDVNGNVTMPLAASTVEHAFFTWHSDQEDVVFECALDGAELCLCTSPLAIWGPLDSGTHELEVRGDERAARRRGARGGLRVDHRARART